MNTGIIYSEKYLDHDIGPGHPEKPERLKAIMDSLNKNKKLLEKIQIIDPTPAEIEEINLAHTSSYIEKVREHSKTGRMIDLDTPINKNTFDLALLSAGGTIDLSKKVEDGELDNGFALVRPPGHHATRNKGGGFCYFNNIAIAGKKLLEESSVEKIMIFDFDSHHGNGTQDIFYEQSDVLYMSFHQSGQTLYPGTGFPKEVGRGDGEGYTVNVPFSPGSSDQDYAAALKEFFLPISEQYEPDIILVSAGFDPHKADTLTQLEVSSDGFGMLGSVAINQAEKLCDGKIFFTLEGGYAIQEEADSKMKIFESMTDPKPTDLEVGEGDYGFRETKKAIQSYWDI